MILYYLGILFTIVMMVESVRRGQSWPWFWIMLFFNLLGAIAYFIIEVQQWVAIPGIGSSSAVQFRTQRVSSAELQRSEAEVRRLDNAAAWSDYAALLRARGRHDEAVVAASKAIERDPDEVHARYERGRSLLELNQTAAAADDLEVVVARNAQHDYGDALLALAKAREGEGQLDEARRLYEQLATRSSRPDVLFQVANIQEQTGDVERAIDTLSRLIDDAELAPSFQRRESRPWVRRAGAALKRLERGRTA